MVKSLSRRRWSALASVLVLMLAIRSVPALAAPAETQAPSSPTAPKAIDINQATEEELTVIPGIGTAMAKRIVDFRQQNGPFRQVEDLMKVKGIGEKSLEKLRAYVKVGKGT